MSSRKVKNQTKKKFRSKPYFETVFFLLKHYSLSDFKNAKLDSNDGETYPINPNTALLFDEIYNKYSTA